MLLHYTSILTNESVSNLYAYEMHRTYREMYPNHENFLHPNVFIQGIDFGYRQCCILFFMSEWRWICDNIHEYIYKADGYVRCPDCILRELKLK